MTKTDLERLAVVETKIDNVCDEISELKQTLKDFIESADKKYAPQYLEKVFWASFGTIFAAGVGVLAYLVNNHFVF